MLQRPANLLAVARGDALADLVLRDARIVNVFTGEIERGDIAIVDGVIAGIGRGYLGKGSIDLAGAFAAPGYIDAHVHIESSLCIPREFARAVLPRGVTAVVTDPHEIANVAGRAGVDFMCAASRGLPLEVIVNVPSCVPATHLASAGGAIDAAGVRSLVDDGIVHGLAEVMNFPGVINGDSQVLAKIDAVRERGGPIDGHCPGVRGTSLSAYVAAGVGSDHESVTIDEAREKISRGLYLLIREATNARNLDALLPLITPANARRICFCTDDRTPGDLLRDGSIDMMVRRAITFGVSPIEAIRMATLNVAEWFRLDHLGAIAPGRVANLIVFDDLDVPTPRAVYARGELVAKDGAMLPDVDFPDFADAADVVGCCKVDLLKLDFRVPARGEKIRVIGSRPDQLVTESLVVTAKTSNGEVVSDVAGDILKIAVVGRHTDVSQQSVGFIKGFGLTRGAMAGTIAHDHHNLVVIGADDDSMRVAAREVTRLGGGLAVAVDGRVIASLALPVGGLMSDQPVEVVAVEYDRLVAAARDLGSPLNDPFMAMSFMALEVDSVAEAHRSGTCRRREV